MRRAKSESAMLIDDREEMLDSLPRGLKRYNKEQPLYHPIQHSKPMSRRYSSGHVQNTVLSVYTIFLTVLNLLRQQWQGIVCCARLQQLQRIRPRRGQYLQQGILYMLNLGLIAYNWLEFVTFRPSSPVRNRYTSPISPRARFAEPAVVEAQQPHGGFSYLFPSQPVVASVVPKRAITPEPARQVCFKRGTSLYSFSLRLLPAVRRPFHCMQQHILQFHGVFLQDMTEWKRSE